MFIEEKWEKWLVEFVLWGDTVLANCCKTWENGKVGEMKMKKKTGQKWKSDKNG